MIHAQLNCFNPQLYDYQATTVTIGAGFGKLCGANSRRCFLFASTFPNPGIADPQIRIGGDGANNAVLRVDDLFKIALNWRYHGKLVTQEVWIGLLGGAVTYNVVEVILLPLNRRRVHEASTRLRSITDSIESDLSSRNGRSRGNIASTKRESAKSRLIHNPEPKQSIQYGRKPGASS